MLPATIQDRSVDEVAMSRVIAERFQRWFEYERDAHARVLRSLESVPAERRSCAEFERAVSILAHIAAARRLWLIRLGVIQGQATLSPKEVTLAEVAALLDSVHALWTDYLAGVTDEDLAREFEYQSLDAGRFRNRIEEILAQLFGHSWYHRGQIAMLVRAAGGEPAVTDLIYWCRQAVPPGSP
jgi:uncharacterized damage-inducible protein DinB